MPMRSGIRSFINNAYVLRLKIKNAFQKKVLKEDLYGCLMLRGNYELIGNPTTVSVDLNVLLIQFI